MVKTEELLFARRRCDSQSQRAAGKTSDPVLTVNAASRIMFSFKEVCHGQCGSSAIPEGKYSWASEREDHLRRTYLGTRKDDHPSGKNNVWLWCGCWHWRRGRYQRSRRRRWWRWRSTSCPGGRYRGERAADPVRSDYGSEEADWGCAGGNCIGYVGGVAQTSPTLICGVR